jgi:hypothetical protein
MVQKLSFERQRSEHAIEGADAIGDDDESPSVLRRVVVADLALVLLTERVEVSALERVAERGCESRPVDHGARTIARLSSKLMPEIGAAPAVADDSRQFLSRTPIPGGSGIVVKPAAS